MTELLTPLPSGWAARRPGAADVDPLVRLLRRHEREARGWPGATSDSVWAEVTGPGAGTRRHLLVADGDGTVRAWLSAHDRAAGRVLVGLTVDPDLPDAQGDQVAAACWSQAEQWGAQIARERGLATTQLDSGAFADDPRQHRWLEAAGYEHVRDWWQMSRPVRPQESTSLPPSRPGVVIRPVRRADDGMPDESDLRAVHQVLEESFADHFNSYRESFEEFLSRLREDPGHRWDHWWLADVDGRPAGAVVASTLTAPDDAPDRADGTYLDYIGVAAQARGRGVAKALLHTVVADAAQRGRDRVDLEVDADSPTGAGGLYVAMGWQTRYVTQSWHHRVRAAAG